MLRLLGGAVQIAYPDGDTMLVTGSGVTVRLRAALGPLRAHPVYFPRSNSRPIPRHDKGKWIQTGGN